jgi:uncharacterized protein YcbK (DUF882 family)
MNSEFMGMLERVRLFTGPLAVTSAYRCPEYNALVSHSGATGPHTTRRAVDIRIRGGDALALIQYALEEGMTGIGVKQHGDSRFIHLDNLTTNPRPWIWSYT